MGTAPLSSGLSRLEREGDYAVPSSAVVKDEWRYIYARSMFLNVGCMFGQNEGRFIKFEKKNCHIDLVKRKNIKTKVSGNKVN